MISSKWFVITALFFQVFIANHTLANQNTITPQACSSSDILLTFEEPRENGYYSSIGNVRGWTWGRCGIERVELTIDGELYGRIPGGGIRNDVTLIYPEEEFPGSANSGYSMAFNYANLDPGSHSMQIRVIDTEGNEQSSTHNFTTNRFGQKFTFDVASVDVTDASFTRKKSGLNVTNSKINGGNYDFELNWRDATQSFTIENISGRESFAPASTTESGPSNIRSLAGSSAADRAAWPATPDHIAQNNGIVLNFEEPVLGSGYSSISNIRGWAVSPAGMDRIELIMDGEPFGNVPIGGTRSDVSAIFPSDEYQGSDESGFSMAYNYANLEPGQHTFTIRAYDQTGAIAEKSSTLTVNRFNTRFLKGESLLNMTTANVRAQSNAITIAGINLDPEQAAANNLQAMDDNNPYQNRLEFDSASQSFKLSNISQDTHTWGTGQWSACTGDCGHLNASRIRSISCLDGNGDNVDAGLCPQPSPPTTARCTACDTYQWLRGTWGTCSGACGRGLGQQTRTVSCVTDNNNPTDDANCGLDKPDTSQSCTACDVYTWYEGNWGVCEGDCGTDNATQSRQVFCQNSSGQAVEDTLCDGDKPSTTQACTASECPIVDTYHWDTGSWSECTGECGVNNGTRTRLVLCRAPTGETVADDFCTDAKPDTSESCTASLCPTTPITPTGVTASDASYTDRVEVTWDMTSGADSYQVTRCGSINPDADCTQLASDITGLSWDDTSATPGATYYYRVQSCIADLCSEFSASDAGSIALSGLAAQLAGGWSGTASVLAHTEPHENERCDWDVKMTLNTNGSATGTATLTHASSTTSQCVSGSGSGTWTVSDSGILSIQVTQTDITLLNGATFNFETTDPTRISYTQRGELLGVAYTGSLSLTHD